MPKAQTQIYSSGLQRVGAALPSFHVPKRSTKVSKEYMHVIIACGVCSYSGDYS